MSGHIVKTSLAFFAQALAAPTRVAPPLAARRRRWAASFALIGILGLGGATRAIGQDVCWPFLTFKSVGLSAMKPPLLERKWTAILAVDAGACESASGPFIIGFSRQKENAPDRDFRARFKWQHPTVEVSLDFSADEAVQRYWLDYVAPCACRD